MVQTWPSLARCFAANNDPAAMHPMDKTNSSAICAPGVMPRPRRTPIVVNSALSQRRQPTAYNGQRYCQSWRNQRRRCTRTGGRQISESLSVRSVTPLAVMLTKTVTPIRPMECNVPMARMQRNVTSQLLSRFCFRFIASSSKTSPTSPWRSEPWWLIFSITAYSRRVTRTLERGAEFTCQGSSWFRRVENLGCE